MNWPWLELQIVHWPSAATEHDAGMRLDIGLVHRLGRVAAARSMTSASLKPASTSPLAKVTRLAMFDGLVGFGSTPAVKRSSCSTGASGRHRVLDIDDVRQYLVLDLDQVERLLGDRRRGRGDGGDGVALIQHLVARHAVARQVAEVHRPLADKRLLRRDVREIGAR